MLRFNQDIAPYLLAHGKALPDEKVLHKYYKQSIAENKLIASVFSDVMPDFLKVDRPKERSKASHQKFRQEIYKAITKPFRRRLIRTLSAIRNADDFIIDFPKVDTSIKPEDTLQHYTTEEFGAWKSVEQWFWDQGVQRYIDDPNTCAVLIPQIPEIPTQFRTVLPIWAGCAQVWYYAEGERAVVCSEKKNPVLRNGKTTLDGLILYFFDRESYCIAKQVAVNGTNTQWDIMGLEVVQDMEGNFTGYSENFPRHYFRAMPVFRVGSLMKETSEDGTFVLYESLVSDAIPHLKSVLQRASDIDIEALLHTGSLEWQYVTKKCDPCSGKGFVETVTTTEGGKKKKIMTKCPKCSGAGWDVFDSNLEKILISAPVATDFDDDTKVVNLPTPPAGMIERSPDAIREFRDEYKRNMTEAYQAVGLGHISDQLFMSTSGTSKRYDRDEGEKMIMDTSKHFVDRLLNPIYAGIDCIRYGPIGLQGKQAPIIKAPKRFDITTIDMTRDQLNDAMTNDYSEELKDALQVKYLDQTVGKESIEYKVFRVKTMIDPHRNKTDEMKSFLISQAYLTMDRESEGFKKTVEQIQFSINFEAVLRDAVMKDPEFFFKNVDQQYAVLMEANKAYFSVRPAGQPIEMSTLAPLVNAKDINQMEN